MFIFGKLVTIELFCIKKLDNDLQIATNIIQKEFGKRRYKVVNSIDIIKNKCIMSEISDDHSPSIVL